MNRYVIHKYPVPVNPKHNAFGIVELPEGSKILDLQFQDEHPVIWAMHNTDVIRKTARKYRWVATGEEVTDEEGIERMDHIGTLQRNGIVLHLFIMQERVRGR